ncbi:MAG: hypothetical protein ABI999_05460 [Acidobacteriota bacterium]
MKRNIFDRRSSVCTLLLVVATLFFAIANLRTAGVEARSVAALPSATPSYSGYKGVKIGMTTDDARKLLGTPKEKSDTQDYYVYSENESAQILYDAAHTVTAISVTYMGKLASVPGPKDIFGEDAETKPDGSIMKMVRYPKNGFWLSYNKTSGDDPLIIITAQKMNSSPE